MDRADDAVLRRRTSRPSVGRDAGARGRSSTMMRATSTFASTSPPWSWMQAISASVSLPAAADRHADAVGLEEADEHERADAGRLLVGRHEVLAGDAREVHAHLVVLEQCCTAGRACSSA